MIKLVEKRPPTPTGNMEEDIARLREYNDYLREQINYILTLLDKRMNEGGI